MTDEEFLKLKKEGERIRHERERRMVAILVASSVFQEALDYIEAAQQIRAADGADICPHCDRLNKLHCGCNEVAE